MRKPGYEPSRAFTGIVSGTGHSLGNISLNPIVSTIIISGTLNGSTELSGKKAFASLLGYNPDGTENTKWFGKEILVGTGGAFEITDVPAGFGNGKLNIAVEGYISAKTGITAFGSSNRSVGTIAIALAELFRPVTAPITPSQGGTISDAVSGFKITLPASAM